MLRFSANLSLLFTELDMLNRFKAAKDSGFDAVEIQFPYEIPALQIQQQLLENQLKLVLFNVAAGDLLQGGSGLASAPEKKSLFIDALQQCKAYAEILQPEAINVLAGRCLDQNKKEQCLATFRHNLLLALNVFTPIGIKTVFEAINTDDVPGFLIHSEQQMLEIIEQINHPMLYLQYDIYHMTKMNQNPIAFIKRYSEKIAHIQFADAPGRAQPGTGKIDFEAIFSSIQKSNYQGWVGAEYNPCGLTAKSFDWLSNDQSNRGS